MSGKALRLSALVALLLAVVSSACVATLPAETLPPTAQTESESPKSQLVAEDVVPSDAVIEEDEYVSPAEDNAPAPTPIPEQTATPVAPTLTPTPPLPPFLEDVALRDSALEYLRGGYLLKLPDNSNFESGDPPEESVGEEVIVKVYRSGPWMLMLGDATYAGDQVRRTIIVSNQKSGARWWGEMDGNGVLSTTVSAGLPRPKSKQLNEWAGHVVKLPEGSVFDDYVEGANGAQHGIQSNKAQITDILENLTNYDGRVRLWGELRYAVNDYNARRLIVRKINLLDGPIPPTPTPEPLPEVQTQSGTEEEILAIGPIGIISNPLPGSIAQDRVIVSGEAEGVFENNVIIQIENDDGAVLGRGFALTDAPDMGQTGRFVAEIAIEAAATTQGGRVALYAEDARDGSLILLIWTPIQFAGPGSDRSAAILKPDPQTNITGSVLVRGTANGVNNRTVLVRVEDVAGTVWGKAQAKTDKAGNWELRLRFRNPPTGRSGRIAVYDRNPEDDRLTLLVATDVELAK
ncbi:MAG: hypothetical protein GY762_22140 [Proteobacteria bacterium]|nr:hypothetical protein [Pseudomonadota bacterium]